MEGQEKGINKRISVKNVLLFALVGFGGFIIGTITNMLVTYKLMERLMEHNLMRF